MHITILGFCWLQRGAAATGSKNSSLRYDSTRITPNTTMHSGRLFSSPDNSPKRLQNLRWPRASSRIYPASRIIWKLRAGQRHPSNTDRGSHGQPVFRYEIGSIDRRVSKPAFRPNDNLLFILRKPGRPPCERTIGDDEMFARTHQ